MSFETIISGRCFSGSLRNSTSFWLIAKKPSSNECCKRRVFMVSSETLLRCVKIKLIVSKAPVLWVANLRRRRMTYVKLLLFCCMIWLQSVRICFICWLPPRLTSRISDKKFAHFYKTRENDKHLNQQLFLCQSTYIFTFSIFWNTINNDST